MKVLFVCNNAYHPGNGQSVAVRKMIVALREHGVDARLMAIANSNPDGPQPDFPLEHWKYPVFEPLLYKNGSCNVPKCRFVAGAMKRTFC